MSDRPIRCPFCSGTDLAPLASGNWSCVGSLGCGGVWDAAVIVAPPPRVDPAPDPEPVRPVRQLRLGTGRRLLRRMGPRRLFDAA